jgi:hypothetical protein
LIPLCSILPSGETSLSEESETTNETLIYYQEAGWSILLEARCSLNGFDASYIFLLKVAADWNASAYQLLDTFIALSSLHHFISFSLSGFLAVTFAHCV